jgi:hypothetical protein
VTCNCGVVVETRARFGFRSGDILRVLNLLAYLDSLQLAFRAETGTRAARSLEWKARMIGTQSTTVAVHDKREVPEPYAKAGCRTVALQWDRCRRTAESGRCSLVRDGFCV